MRRLAFSGFIKKSREFSNIFYLKAFLIFAALLIILSVLYKGVLLFETRYFTGDSFSLLFITKDAYIVTVNRQMNSAGVLTIKNANGKLSKNSAVSDSIRLGVPVEGIISSRNPNFILNSSDPVSPTIIANALLLNPKYTFYHVNVIDLLNMYIAFHAASRENLNTYTIDLKNSDYLSSAQQGLYSLFENVYIINEKTSIEIVNSTTVFGLGTKVANVLKNIGYNVVAVNSGEGAANSKIINRSSGQTHALKNLIELFPAKVVNRKEVYIADISLIIGNDIGSYIK